MPSQQLRLTLATLSAGIVLVAILAAVVVSFRQQEVELVHQTIIEQEAALLRGEALRQMAENESSEVGTDAVDLLWPFLKKKEQEGMLAVAIFNEQMEAQQTAPANLLLPELSPEDFPSLLSGQPVSHYLTAEEFNRNFPGLSSASPVLEVILPLHGSDPNQRAGFVQYFMGAERLGAKLQELDAKMNRETTETLVFGACLIGGVLAALYFGLGRARRDIEERNQRLIRANFELTLAARASAVGQIASHLIHGLQGSVAGLRAVTSGISPEGDPQANLRSAADYADRLQAIIQETVALLGDIGGQVIYELNGAELAQIIQERSRKSAADKQVRVEVVGESSFSLDGRRGGLLCLIATNLVQNAIAATPPGRRVWVNLKKDASEAVLVVADEGSGIPEAVRSRLFEPGNTTRAGGTGLGLAISRLLARQIGGELTLEGTDPAGTTFRLSLPIAAV